MKGKGRSSADEMLAVALAGGSTVADAAQVANVSESTAYRRLADLDFTRRVRELRMSASAQAAGRLSAALTQAVDTLRTLLTHDEAAIRLRAATALLASGHDATVADLHDELSDIRERLGETGQ